MRKVAYIPRAMVSHCCHNISSKPAAGVSLGAVQAPDREASRWALEKGIAVWLEAFMAHGEVMLGRALFMRGLTILASADFLRKIQSVPGVRVIARSASGASMSLNGALTNGFSARCSKSPRNERRPEAI